MKQITVAGLVIVMLGSITSNSVWARGEGGYGDGFRGIGGHNGGGQFEGHDRHNDGGFGGTGGHYGGRFWGNGRHHGRGLGYYGLPYYAPNFVYPTPNQLLVLLPRSGGLPIFISNLLLYLT